MGKTAAPKMMKWKCATTKYVSVVAWSKGIAANMIPESPPTTKKAMKPPMKRSGALNSGRPIITVTVQAKSWIVDGMTTIMLAAAKKTSVTAGIPVANMWCAQTPKPMKATSSSAIATSGNATIRCFAKVGMIDVAIPKAGRTMMYTSGWPKNQNRCCQSSDEPPWATSKKWNPRRWWSSQKAQSTVSGGSAKISEP